MSEGTQEPTRSDGQAPHPFVSGGTLQQCVYSGAKLSTRKFLD
ncbi:hypothetical protein halTADL_1920 [Halohasta litchfieldiae]|nr:hypothetical protein halTADL_1920 [Halohasta litchfieldiae]